MSPSCHCICPGSGSIGSGSGSGGTSIVTIDPPCFAACPSVARVWRVTISGSAAGNLCCPNMNGTYVLYWAEDLGIGGVPCGWYSLEREQSYTPLGGGSCVDDPAVARLALAMFSSNVSLTVRGRFVGNNQASYYFLGTPGNPHTSLDEFNCVGSNTLYYQDPGATPTLVDVCSSFPTTLTIEPV